MAPDDPTRRFGNRAEEYRKARPGYPGGILPFVERTLGPIKGWRVADIGSGTGLLSQVFLEAGCSVCGVEPNAEMREAGEEDLKGFAHFRSVDGSAERTGLADASVECVIAGQAFHWFDAEAVRGEWRRITTEPRGCVLVWNLRRLTGTPFLEAYEAFLRTWGTDYESVSARYADGDAIRRVFGHEDFAHGVFDNAQVFDRDGLKGRLLSSSYVPGPDDPRCAPMLRALDELFDTFADAGTVRFDYDTEVFCGRLG